MHRDQLRAIKSMTAEERRHLMSGQEQEFDRRSLLVHVNEALGMLEAASITWAHFWFKCGLISDRIGTAGALGYYSVPLETPIIELWNAAKSESADVASENLREIRRMLTPVT